MGDDDLRRTEALAELPTVYAIALRLHDAAVPPGRIAEILDVEPEAIGPLLLVAEAKLTEVLRRNPLR